MSLNHINKWTSSNWTSDFNFLPKQVIWAMFFHIIASCIVAEGKPIAYKGCCKHCFLSFIILRLIIMSQSQSTPNVLLNMNCFRSRTHNPESIAHRFVRGKLDKHISQDYPCNGLLCDAYYAICIVNVFPFSPCFFSLYHYKLVV